jgi:Flp pilus assembly protein TadG
MTSARRPAAGGPLPPRRGISLIWTTGALVVLTAFCSLAIDVGRVQLAKRELQQAADAAARYAVKGMPLGPSSARGYARDAAADNKADGRTVELRTSEDVEFGTWDPATRSFTLLSGGAEPSANAVRVTARCAASRGTAVPLIFGQVLGRPTCDARAVAIATVAPMNYGIVGLDYIKMGGNASASYWSANGTPAAGNWGNIASNGDITLSGSTLIKGHARPGPGRTVYGAAGRVTGSTAPLASALTYPPADSSPYGMTYNDDDANCPSGFFTSGSLNFSVGSGKSCTLPGGTYYFSTFDVSGTVTFTGPATVYCFNQVRVGGTVNTYASLPKNLRIVTVAHPNTGADPGTVSLANSSTLCASIYAPLSPLTMSGNGDFYGSVVAKSIDMTGTSALYYDLALSANAGQVQVVR